MDTDRVKLLKYQGCLRCSFENLDGDQQKIENALDGLTKLIQLSEQDHILEQAIKNLCTFLLCSSFFSEEDRLVFIKTLSKEAQRYGWDLNKNMVN